MSSRAHAGSGKYLTFALAGEEYGVPVERVHEINAVDDITPLPQMPNHVKGIIDLHGIVIPIVDLRVKFGLQPEALRSCIIVVEVLLGARHLLIGVVVDSVSAVLNVAAGDIRPAREVGATIDAVYVCGVATIADAITPLIDLDCLLAADAALTHPV
jgi:purine-binding chemotaxis protein CheW